ncbi:MAG: DUF5939 domain-containing protein [Planctomycetota bacterium]
MPYKELHFEWEWDLRSTPEALWPMVTDTNRFNEAVGLPVVSELLPSPEPELGVRRIRTKLFGLMELVWTEEPFEWVRPYRMGVERLYEKGPVKQMKVQLELLPQDGGARLRYTIDAEPRNIIGRLILPLELGRKMGPRFEKAFRQFDDEIQAAIKEGAASAATVKMAAPVRPPTIRLRRFQDQLVAVGVRDEVAARVIDMVQNGDDLTVFRIRPYRLADRWGVSRREVLEACLQATRLGLLEMQWSLLCPLCRGAKETVNSLSDVAQTIHCDSCNIDYTANFERSVEATFRPSPGVREVTVTEFCVGGPQVTPHIVAQIRLQPGRSKYVEPLLDAGRFRIRTRTIPGGLFLRAEGGEQIRETIEDTALPAAAGAMITGAGGAPMQEYTVRALDEGWSSDEPLVARRPKLEFVNSTNEEQVFVLERTKWSDDAATAAEVTVLQKFRDLFADAALRPGEKVSVGTVAILFTDLKGSTAMYRDIGDAPAFGRVMYHFDVLREAIDAADGSLVKTIGDAVMAVFRRPAHALKAILGAQYELMQPVDGGEPLILKAGMHVGPSIAVTLNNRLDYFGSTVNMAARLEGQSSGGDIIVSDSVIADPDVEQLLKEQADAFQAEEYQTELKGFHGETFKLFRIRVNPRVLADESRLKDSGVWVRSQQKRIAATRLLKRGG